MALNKYVILASDGSSHDCSKRTLYHSTSFDLADLLEDGWRPVHETPLGRCPFYFAEDKVMEYTCVLILLTKDK